MLGQRRLSWPKTPWLRGATILWGLLTLAVIVRGILQPSRRSVYPVFEAATHQWWQRLSLYEHVGRLDLFRYTPTFAVGFTPFAVLPTWLGLALWNLLGIGLLLVALHQLLHHLFPQTLDVRQQGIFFVLVCGGSLRGIWSAQSNAHLLALAIFACVCVLRRRWWPAALLLGAAFYVKLWPVALVMLLASYRPRPLITRFLAVCGVLFLVPFAAGPSDYVVARYREFLESIERTRHMRWAGNRDIVTIFEAFGGIDAHALLTIQGVAAVGVLLWLHRQRRKGLSEGHVLTLTLAAWAAWQLLFGPGTERLTYGLIAPFTAWAVLVSPEDSSLKRLAWTSWIFTVILGSGAAERALQPYFSASPIIQPLGVVVFFAWLGVYGVGLSDSSPEGVTNQLA